MNNRLGQMGLRARILSIAFVIVVAATTGAISTSTYLFSERQILTQQSRALAVAKSLDAQLQRLLSLGMPLDEIYGFDVQCREAVANNAGLSAAMVFDPVGNLLFHGGGPEDAPAVTLGLHAALAAHNEFVRDEAASTFYSLHRIVGGDGALIGTVVVGFPFALIEAQRNRLLASAALVAFAAAGIGLLLMLFALSRYVMRPISTLVQSLSKIRIDNGQNLVERLPESGLYEFDAMAKGVNRVLDRFVQHESALRQAKDQAVAGNRAKSAFLATMSHELRTPMHAIMGFTELAERKTRDEKLLGYFKKMRQAQRNLLAIIDDVLDISRLEAGRMPLEACPLEVASLVDSQCALIDGMARDKQLRVTVDMQPELRQAVFLGDADRLGQVLLNLLSNAVKFTDAGEIRIAAKIVDTSATGQTRLRFEVEDTGIGIREQEMARLFRTFEQLDSSTTRQHGGTGLGLAISKHIVELMGGEIGVASSYGVGSRFWFSLDLPRVTGSVDLPAGQQSQEDLEGSIRVMFRGKRVLVAEDDEANRQVIGDLLAHVGLGVDLAADGLDALRAASSEVHAMVFLDLQMPRMDGLSVARMLRKMPEMDKLPIIAFTANVLPEHQKQCMDAGIDDFLAKPVEARDFYAVVLRWLRHKSPQPSQVIAFPEANSRHRPQ